MDLNGCKCNKVQNHALWISTLPKALYVTKTIVCYKTIIVGDLSSVVYPQRLPPHGSQYNFRQGKTWICNINYT